MAGLFGSLGSAPQSQGQGGILGYGQQPQWAQQLGLLSAGLKDASAQWTGHPADANNLQEYTNNLRQMQMRQQLMQGLSSDDPSARQQAYSTAALLGIDTKPIQQQQASQALPKLLQSMQPSTQTVAPTSAPLPNLPGQTVQGGNFSFQAPGMPLGDALAQSGSPELQSQYAPELIQSQIAQQAKLNDPYTLGPGEQRRVGDQVIASTPLKPTPNQPFNPDGTPNKAFQTYQVNLAREKAKARADYRAPPKVAPTSGFSNPAALFGGR